MKIVVVGAGNAGCFTALHYAYWTQNQEKIEVELVYNPDIQSERVGQATFQEVPDLLYKALGFDWYNNSINATPKSGILYEGWGKKKDKFFHPFPANHMAMHYCPWEMQKYVLESGYFNVRESNVLEPSNIDADYVFDCRGKPKDFTDYNELKNPTNACILAKPNWDTTKALWSRHVATPDGWTFVIPTHEDSPSYDYCVGYCYNSNITSKEDAERNMLEMFDVEITRHLQYKNYVAKNPVIDDRIVLNGNRLFFLEPLESSGVGGYLQVARWSMNSFISKSISSKELSTKIQDIVRRIENFVLYHYQFGSKYDTPFWNYAKTLTFKDPDFNLILKDKSVVQKKESLYGLWYPTSIKMWQKGML